LFPNRSLGPTASERLHDVGLNEVALVWRDLEANIRSPYENTIIGKLFDTVYLSTVKKSTIGEGICFIPAETPPPLTTNVSTSVRLAIPISISHPIGYIGT
jgi:hypothetical protein